MYVIANLNHPRSLSINLDRPWRIQMHMLPYMHPLATKPRYILLRRGLVPVYQLQDKLFKAHLLTCSVPDGYVYKSGKTHCRGLEIPP